MCRAKSGDPGAETGGAARSRRRPVCRHAAAPLLLLVLTASAQGVAAPQRPAVTTQERRAQLTATVVPTWDFETGDLRGWRATGDAFAFQPTYGDNPAARNAGSANHQGNYWIGTFERYPDARSGRAGMVQGDGPQGVLTSAPFTIPRGSMSFLIGGGSSIATRVELLVLDPIEGSTRVLYATGQNSETMRRESWDLAQWAGRQGLIRIVDESSAGWGHINVDDFRFPSIGVAVPDLPDRPIARPPLELARTRVPPVTGRMLDAATELVAEARLRVGEVGREESERAPGTVLAQDPEPGTVVFINSPVNLVIAAPAPPERTPPGEERPPPGGERPPGEERPPPGGERPPPEQGYRNVLVPDLARRSEVEARRLLEDAGLAVGVVTTRPSPAAPGTVIAQAPEAGSTVPAGSAVSFALAETETVTVPDLVGRSSREASGILEGLRLAVGTIQRRESREPEGTVLDQRPGPANQVVVGTAIDLMVAIPVMVAVPDLVGRSEADARALLGRAELSVGSVEQQESSAPPGTVLSQAPEAGSRLELGTAVDLVIATPITVPVPDLIGQTDSTARRLLATARLGVGPVRRVESRQPVNTVLSQDIEADSRVELGTAVGYAIAIPLTVPVPDLVGSSEAEARDALEELELGLGALTPRESREAAGTVIAQTPAAGQSVVIGSNVDVVVAVPVTVLVPGLVGRPEAEARQLVAETELVAGSTTSEESREPRGSVLAQSIAPGTRVEIGTPVDLIVARPVTVLVPELVGGSESEARSLLETAELVVGDIEQQESAAQPGTVLAQGLNPGSRVEIGTPVTMVVAVVETVEIPALVGLPVEEARRALVVGRLEVGTEEPRETRTEEEGTVLEQGRPAGTVAAVGTPINVVVATPEMVTVPSVVGMSHAEAVAAITAVGLPVGAVAEQLSLQPGGTVLAQGQPAGTQVVFTTPIAMQEARPRIVWAAPATLLLLLVGTVALARLRTSRREAATPPPRRKPRRDKRDLPHLPQLRVRPETDGGAQQFETRERPVTRLEIRLKPVADPGTQEARAEGGIDDIRLDGGAFGSLIRSERRHDD